MEALINAILERGDPLHVGLALLVGALLWVIREQHKALTDERKRLDGLLERHAAERIKSSEVIAAGLDSMRNAVTTLHAHIAALRRTV